MQRSNKSILMHAYSLKLGDIYTVVDIPFTLEGRGRGFKVCFCLLRVRVKIPELEPLDLIHVHVHPKNFYDFAKLY